VPAQDDVRRRLAEPAGDLDQRRVVEDLALRERRPRLGPDLVRPVVGVALVVRRRAVCAELVPDEAAARRAVPLVWRLLEFGFLVPVPAPAEM